MKTKMQNVLAIAAVVVFATAGGVAAAPAAFGTVVGGSAGIRALNPQPLPPGPPPERGMVSNRYGVRALNPQPLPPEPPPHAGSVVVNPYAARALNPQPLPPRFLIGPNPMYRF